MWNHGTLKGKDAHENVLALQLIPTESSGADNPKLSYPNTRFLPSDWAGPVDHRITQMEDKIVNSEKSANESAFKLPRRPGYGTVGQQVKVIANYFEVKSVRDPWPTIYRYSVDYWDARDPPESKPKSKLSKLKRVELFRRILDNPKFENMGSACDRAGIFITSASIMKKGNYFENQEDLALEKGATPRANHAPRPVKFRIEPAGEDSNEVSYQELIDYLSGEIQPENMIYDGKEEWFQLLNILQAHFALQDRRHLFQVGPTNKFYYDSLKNGDHQELEQGLRALRGFVASVRPATGRILLNLNVVCGAFYWPVSLPDLILLLAGKTQRHQLSDVDLSKIEEILRFIRIDLHYTPAPGTDPIKDGTSKSKVTKVKRTLTFCSFAEKFRTPTTQMVTIKGHDGLEQRKTVFSYFNDKYHDQIRYLKKPEWPVANLGSMARPIYVPAELCIVAAGQPTRRLLNPIQTQAMIKAAVKPPIVNADHIRTGGLAMFKLKTIGKPKTLVNPQTKTLIPFGLKVDDKFVRVLARVLQKPRLQYGNIAEPTNSSWNLTGKKFAQAARLGKCVLVKIVFEHNPGRPGPHNQNRTGQGSTRPYDYVTEIPAQFARYGIRLDSFATDELRLQQSQVKQRDQKAARRLIEKFEELVKRNVKFVLFVLADSDRWLYSRIKTYGDVTYGIHTVCMVESKIKGPQYIGNVALKCNVKGGGVNHNLLLSAGSKAGSLHPQGKGLLDGETMLVGIDVTHPPPGSETLAPSVAGVVASIDTHLGQWPASIAKQTGRTEMVAQLTEMVCERLQAWKRKNKQLPTKVVVYRDGVSESQFSAVLKDEVPAFRGAFSRIYQPLGTPLPKLVLVVVSKRHHTRFYPPEPTNTGQPKSGETKTYNCLPGLVVDRGVTHPYLHEFFLQAHEAVKGTAKPARYVVLVDDVGLTADQIQGFTHNLCYLFARATRAVSVCPPAFYAHLVCERARMYLFNKLVETTSSETRVNGANEWDGAIHENLRDSLFYI